MVFEKNVEKLVAFHWRPRPPSLLTEEMHRVRMNINKLLVLVFMVVYYLI